MSDKTKAREESEAAKMREVEEGIQRLRENIERQEKVWLRSLLSRPKQRLFTVEQG